jgi:hypothetical protein
MCVVFSVALLLILPVLSVAGETTSLANEATADPRASF